MSNLVLFVTVFLILWGMTELFGILRRQYRGDEPPIDAVWGPKGMGRSYPANRLGCDVCGVWTPHRTCSECVVWAEIQSIRCENNMTFAVVLDGRMVELKRRRQAAGW